MAITQGQITLDEAATIDKRLQTVTRTSGDTVHNEVFCLISPDAADGDSAMVAVVNSAPSTEYGLVVRNIPSGTQTISGTVTANAGTGDFLSIVGHTRNEAFKESAAIGAEMDETTPVVATEGNVSPLRINAQRSLFVNLRGTGANPLALDTGARTADTLRVTVATDDLVPVSGTVTANAGTGFPPVVTDGAGAGTTGIHILGTDGTNAQILSTNTTGHVNIADGGNVITVDGTITADAGSGTFTVGGTVTANAGTGDFLTIVGHTINEAFKEASAIGGQLDDAATTAATENNIAPVRITAQRALHATLRGTGSNPLALDTGARTADTLRVTVATDDLVPVSGTITANAGTGFPPVVTDGAAVGTTGIHILGTDATNAQIISTNTTGHVNIADGGNVITVDGTVTADAGTGPWPVTDNAGALTVDAANDSSLTTRIGDGTNIANVTAGGRLETEANQPAGAYRVQGNAGDDQTIGANNPNVIGGVARTTDRTAVGAGDAVYASYDILGKAVTSPYASPDELIKADLTKSTTGFATLVAAPGAGVRNYITSISASNSSGTAMLVTFRDSVTTTDTVSFYLAASGGGASHVMPVPWRMDANAILQVDIGAAASSIYFSAQGYTAAA